MIGTEINGRYLIEAELGRGGMGVVYSGRDLLLVRPVAVKVVGPGMLGKEGRARLLREAQAAAGLNHANIVAVFDAGEMQLAGQEGASTYVIMELVQGRTLHDYRPADVAKSLSILAQICAALEAAHAQGVIHRDLKADNVALTPDGQVKLMDFGLAWTGGRSRLTQDGTLMGTFDTMAPEIIRGEAASVQSDLYALGVLAYELLTGRPPFEADTPAAVLSQHLHAPVTPPSAFNSEIPPALEYLVVLLLSKQPESRPTSVAAVGRQLLDITTNAGTVSVDPSAQLSAPRLDFLVRGRLVGRERELGQGVTIWRQAAAGRRQVLLISGEPGIGKTRLATEIGVQAQLDRARLLQGQCFEHGGLPYMPLAQMIRKAFEGEDVPHLPAAVLADLGRIAPEIVRNEPAPELTSEQATEEGRLYESFVALCQVMIQDRPLLLFFDDLHWADSGTIGLVRHLARRLEGAPLLLLATYWEIELAGRQPVQTLLDDLRREAGAQRLELGRLDREQTQALLSTIFSEEISGEFVEAIYDETEGNPFFVEELCKAVVESGDLKYEDGRWQQSAIENIQLPQSIQVAIESRLRQLEERSLDVLRAGALLGREFDYALLQVAAGLPEAELVTALEEALRAQLINELSPTGSERRGTVAFSFSHALIQAAIVNGMGLLRWKMLSRQIATALEEALPGEKLKLAHLLGRLYSEAGAGKRAVPYLIQAGHEDRRLFAYDEAIKSYEQALLYLSDEGDLDQVARTLLTLGATYMKSAQYERARQAYDEAFSLWRQAPHRQKQTGLPAARRAFRGHTGEPLTLDPSRASDTSSTYIARQLYQGLVESGQADEILPAVAASWEILDGGRRYVFHLREDALWSDGEPVVAADFEYAWKRVLEPFEGNRIAPLFTDIRGARRFFEQETADELEIGITAVDRLTLQVELVEPVAYFLHLAATENALPVPRHVVEEHGERWTETGNIVTNGAFVPERWTKGRQIVLNRNPLYNGPFNGNLERVELVLDNDVSLLDEYGAGRLDCLYPQLIRLSSVEQARRRFGADLVTLPSMTTVYLALNCSWPPLEDKRVRQAISLAINRQQLADDAGLGLQQPISSGFIPPGMAGHGLMPKPEYDPQAARQLLAEAGYPEGRGLPPMRCLEVTPPGETKSLGKWLSGQLREQLGLLINTRVVGLAEMLQHSQDDGRQLWYLGWSADYTDPDAFMRAGNWPQICNWPNQHFSQLVEDARSEADLARRLDLYRQAERILADDAPLIPLIYGRWHVLVKPWVRRWPTSATVWTIFRDVILDVEMEDVGV